MATKANTKVETVAEKKPRKSSKNDPTMDTTIMVHLSPELRERVDAYAESLKSEFVAKGLKGVKISREGAILSALDKALQ